MKWFSGMVLTLLVALWIQLSSAAPADTRRGERDDEVVRLQTLLSECGGLFEVPAGDFDRNTGAAISARYAGEELDEKDNIERFIADDSEYRVDVIFTANRSLMNFRVLSLQIENVSNDGSMTFGTEELYALEALTPEKPLVVGMAFWGEIPNMGIAYIDESGTERTFAISISGEDGELVLTEVNERR